MAPDPSTSLATRTFQRIGICLLAAVLYVMSVGPVILFVGNSEPPPWVRKIYSPLIWAAQHTPLQKPLEAYAKWWEKLAGK